MSFLICLMKTQEIILIIKKKIYPVSIFGMMELKLNAYSEKSKFINEINNILGVKQSIVSAYLLKAKRKYDLTKSMFLEQSLT